jgi:D-alanyl-D-alanine carboxypeptidase (penicillin-binding protein 5/6)
MMNQKAKELGMNNTNFVNSYGLDAEGHLTTAHDVAIMSSELIKHKLIRDYSTVKIDSLRGGESELVNTNKLIRYYDGCFGLKTGTTSGAGSCLTATAERNGLTLVAVVLGAPSSKDRFSGTQKLLDYGFANYSYTEVVADMSGFTDIPVKKGTVKYIIPTVTEKLPVLLKKGEEKDITQNFTLETELTAPVKKGDTVGYVHVFLKDEEIGAIPIVASNSSDRLTYFVCLLRVLKNLFAL